MAERIVARAFRGNKTMDGAGVSLTRIFGFGDTAALDPFLLLDHFGSDNPDEYLAGFPWHPHRGIDTVTYMLQGKVRHGDSMGNSGVISPGELQWMTAGSGIIHEEMPQSSPLGVHGFQLWVNLSRAEKMRDPAYRGFAAADVRSIPSAGGEARVLAGELGGVRGPVSGVSRDPSYFDLHLVPGGKLEIDTPEGDTAFAYVYEGSLLCPCEPLVYAGHMKAGTPLAKAEPRPQTESGTCILFGSGDRVRFEAGQAGAAFIFARGTPLHEPIAWGGPIVMNTRAELELAFREYSEGTFIKKR
jgi:redox-sensitive bicupin YhaK (pirin superfamily)